MDNQIKEIIPNYDPNNIIYVYADGATRGNQFKENIGAWAYRLENKDLVKENSGVEINTTNNIMEIKSCIESLKAIKNKNMKTIVVMDSQYVISGINEWIYKWISNKWKNANNKPIENRELWEELFKEKIRFIDICFLKCDGHGNNIGNNRVDKLCNLAMDKMEKT